ncbi:MAG: sodium ion-translocating decarboxylase subunit beta [Bacilli bacterium]|nr:sodium ion-translocating decarboxylase subunit beta [Bacilli bacterium]
MKMVGDLLKNFIDQMGFISYDTNGNFDWVSLGLRAIMIIVALVLIFLAVKKDFEPYLLIPIGVGMLLANLAPGLALQGVGEEADGLLYSFHKGIDWEIFPPLVFLGIGATTDFGPLISRPSSLLLGAAAQFGIFITFFGALLLGFNALEASAIGIIGGADGHTAIFLSNKMLDGSMGGSMLCSSIAVVAYSYMALVPVIQPPIIKALTTKEERKIKMVQPRNVSKREKIIFPIVVMIVVILLIPSCAPLIGMLMLGNLIKESGVVPNLVNAASNTILYVVTILLGISVGSTARLTGAPQAFDFIKILLLGMVAFSFATAAGVLIGKLMSKLSGGKINPMIGAAGVSAVPMAARVVHKIGLEEDKSNYLMMHAMGPNVAGVIGSAVAAGLLLSIFG